MEPITYEWLINIKSLSRSRNTFARTFNIYHSPTKIMFTYISDGKVYVDLSQEDNNIFLGLAKTQNDLKELYKVITRGDEIKMKA